MFNSSPNNRREQGPERTKRREHPRALYPVETMPKSQQYFETDCSLGLLGVPVQLTKVDQKYTNAATTTLQRCYDLGWKARKADVDRAIESVLDRANPELREHLQVAFTKLRMEL
jgi:hypothetical protein